MAVGPWAVGYTRVQKACLGKPGCYRAQFLHYGTIAIITSCTSVSGFHISTCVVVSRARHCRVYNFKLGWHSRIDPTEGRLLCLHGGWSRRWRAEWNLAGIWQWRRLHGAMLAKGYASIGEAQLAFDMNVETLCSFSTCSLVHVSMLLLLRCCCCGFVSNITQDTRCSTYQHLYIQTSERHKSVRMKRNDDVNSAGGCCW